jgi:CRP-like cAMP-binding protein
MAMIVVFATRYDFFIFCFCYGEKAMIVVFATKGGGMIRARILRDCPLFEEIEENQMDALLACLKVVHARYGKEEFVFRAGDKFSMVGVVVSGGVRIIQDDFEGYRTILAHIAPGELFGEAFACADNDVLSISAATSEASEIMMIDYKKLVTTCSSACAFHARMILNMLRILVEKNILLIRKIEHVSKRTTREKILSFLSMQAAIAHSTTIEIPFNRQELADYLCVNRSALSRELSLMQADGLIQHGKRRFQLLRL